MRRKLLKNRLTIVAAVIIITLIGISVFVYYPRSTGPEHKQPSCEYFAFIETGAFAKKITDDVIRISTLHLNVSVLNGTATDLTIMTKSGMLDTSQYSGLNLSNGTSTIADLEFQSDIQVKRTNGTFPVTVTLICEEAEGDKIAYVTDSQIVWIPRS